MRSGMQHSARKRSCSARLRRLVALVGELVVSSDVCADASVSEARSRMRSVALVSNVMVGQEAQRLLALLVELLLVVLGSRAPGFVPFSARICNGLMQQEDGQLSVEHLHERAPVPRLEGVLALALLRGWREVGETDREAAVSHRLDEHHAQDVRQLHALGPGQRVGTPGDLWTDAETNDRTELRHAAFIALARSRIDLLEGVGRPTGFAAVGLLQVRAFALIPSRGLASRPALRIPGARDSRPSNLP